jgi:two-component system, cell cycle sensor histidine kinase and response regulator CckA
MARDGQVTRCPGMGKCRGSHGWRQRPGSMDGGSGPASRASTIRYCMFPKDRIYRDIAGKEGDVTMDTRSRKGDGQGGTVLLVEDADVVRDVVAKMLESFGLTVLQASGGEEALALARWGDAAIDLLLTDIVMPEMSGVELADRMEQERPDMRILFMTGYAEEVVVNQGILRKHRECIGKPFTQEQITKKVRKILFP